MGQGEEVGQPGNMWRRVSKVLPAVRCWRVGDWELMMYEGGERWAAWNINHDYGFHLRSPGRPFIAPPLRPQWRPMKWSSPMAMSTVFPKPAKFSLECFWVSREHQGIRGEKISDCCCVLDSMILSFIHFKWISFHWGYGHLCDSALTWLLFQMPRLYS